MQAQKAAADEAARVADEHTKLELKAQKVAAELLLAAEKKRAAEDEARVAKLKADEQIARMKAAEDADAMRRAEVAAAAKKELELKDDAIKKARIQATTSVKVASPAPAPPPKPARDAVIEAAKAGDMARVRACLDAGSPIDERDKVR